MKISFTRISAASVRVRITIEQDKELTMLVPWERLHEIFFHLAAMHIQEYSYEPRMSVVANKEEEKH